MTNGDVNLLITQANLDLALQHSRVKIERRGEFLSLRGTLPPKPGDDSINPKQQRIRTKISATYSGVKVAKQKAIFVTTLLNSDTFDWSAIDQKYQEQNIKVKGSRKGRAKGQNSKNHHLMNCPAKKHKNLSGTPKGCTNEQAGNLQLGRKGVATLQVLLTTYRGMIERCYNPQSSYYNHYGGRGIYVCERWLGACGVLAFIQDMGPKEVGMTIDRIDNNKGYEPGNCRWVSNQTNQRNRGNVTEVEYKGKMCRLINLCESLDIDPGAVKNRIRRGWDIADAIETPGIRGYQSYLDDLEKRKTS